MSAGATAAVREGREYPRAPVVGVAGVVIRGGQVLLIQREREPLKGRWSLPGGALEVGETMSEGVAREVAEETGVRVRPVEIVATIDRISRDAEGRAQFHYVLVDWLCVSESAGGEPMCGYDASAVAWAEMDGLGRFGLEDVTVEVIERAAGRAREMGL